MALLKSMKVFIPVVETGNFVSVPERLGMSHVMLFKHVSDHNEHFAPGCLIASRGG